MKNQADAICHMFETVSLRAPENAVGFVLWRVFARYQREMDRSLASLDLTNLQFVTLTLAAWFGRTDEAVSQIELARFGGIHPMQVSHMLRTLERKGLVKRQRSSSDTRTNEVAITQDGLRLLRQALPKAVEVQSRFFGDEGRPGGSTLAALLALDREPYASEED